LFFLQENDVVVFGKIFDTNIELHNMLGFLLGIKKTRENRGKPGNLKS
jgi:hypothetical protein